MDLKKLTTFAEAQLRAHGLYDKGWRFRYDAAKVRFGACRYGAKVISLSKHLAALNDEAACRDTLLHEIAHALAGKKAGHGPKWKAMCREVGARPVRCYGKGEVAQPPPRYWAVCPLCDQRLPYHRRPRRLPACAPCCKQHNRGFYDARFRLRLVDAATSEKIKFDAPQRARLPKYVGACPACGETFPFYRKQKVEKACGKCCKRHAAGRFDPRFKLDIRQVR